MTFDAMVCILHTRQIVSQSCVYKTINPIFSECFFLKFFILKKLANAEQLTGLGHEPKFRNSAWVYKHKTVTNNLSDMLKVLA